MDARMAIRLSAMTMLVTVGLVAVGVRPAQGATTIKRCDPSVAVAGQGDLRVEVDRKMIVVAGVVARADSDLLRKELKSVVDASGKVKGRSMCLVLRIRAGGANYVTESIPSLSKSPLVVCPGSWRGKTPSTTWSSASCMTFDASTPAVLPGPENSNTHMSIAIRPVNGSVDEIDLDLRYTAVDAAFECFVGGRRDRCTLLPPSIAK